MKKLIFVMSIFFLVFIARAYGFTGTGMVIELEESRPEWFGAKGDGKTDDTLAINAAIQSTNGWVKFTPGNTYIFNPSTNMTFEGGPVKVAFPMKSNMNLDMTGAILKLKDNFSTDASPQAYAMFGSTGYLSNIIFKGGTLDGNGAHNHISPNRGSNNYIRYNQAFIIFSSINARGDNVLADGVTFQNTAGTSAIVMGQCNSVGSLLGNGWRVKNCVFKNNGLDTDDRAGIYGFAENVTIDANTFLNDSPPTFGTDAAIEVHGANTHVTNNKITNLFQGMWVSVNYTNDVHDVIIANNLMTVQQTGIDFERDLANEKNLYGISLKSNMINLDNTSNRSSLFKAGFVIGARNQIHDIIISENTITKVGGYSHPSAGIVLQYPQSRQKHTGIVLDHNKFVNIVCGLYANINAGGTYGTITYNNNTALNLLPATGYPTPFGVIIATVSGSPFDYLEIKGNSFVDNVSGVPISTGIYLSGYQNDIFIEGNSYKNMKSNYAEGAFTTTYRHGREARSVFVTAPSSGAWVKGDEAYTTNTAEFGATGSKYRIFGWRRLTSGSGNVLNTDWSEMRVLTGN